MSGTARGGQWAGCQASRGGQLGLTQSPLCPLLAGAPERSQIFGLARTLPGCQPRWSHSCSMKLMVGSAGQEGGPQETRAPSEWLVYHSWIIGAAVVNAFYSPNRNQIGMFTPPRPPQPLQCQRRVGKERPPSPSSWAPVLCSEGEWVPPLPPVGTSPRHSPAGNLRSCVCV